MSRLSPYAVRSIGAAVAAALAVPTLAWAGPPYLTDDPQPTDPGHWEIYNFVIGSHDADGLGGESGFDLNYGAAKDLQLTAVLPLAFGNPNGFSTDGFRGGTGVIELAAKYKLLHAEDQSLTPDISFFPRVFVPTDHRYGTGHVGLLLPVWAEKDYGPWQLFGGGGYQINPGASQRDFWQGGVALNRTIDKRLSLGFEMFGQTRAATDGLGYTAIDAGVTYQLVQHWSLLASAGPTWEQRGRDGQVFYLALKADY